MIPAALRAGVDELRGDGRGWILASIAVGWFLTIGARVVFPAVLPAVRASFGFDLTTAGLLLTSLWLAYALAQFPGGLLGDRIGERNVLVASAATAMGVAAALALAVDTATFFAATVAFGLGTGLFTTTRFTVLNDVFPERGATAIGLTASAGSLGSTVLPVAAGFLAAAVSWRAGFWLLFPLYAVTVVGLWRSIPARTSDGPGTAEQFSPANRRRIRRAVTRRPVVLATLSMLLMSALYQGFTGFYPTYLVSVEGLDGEVAAVVFGLFFAAGIVIQPAAGAIADRFGPGVTLVVTTATTAAAVAAVPLVHGVGPLAALTVVVSVQLGFWPVVQAFVVGLLPTEVQGSAFGLLRTVYLIGASFGPTVVGVIADAGRFDVAFLVLAGFGTAATTLVVALVAGRRP